MKAGGIERVELSPERVIKLLERAKAVFQEEDYRDLENLVKSFAYLTQLLEDKRTTVRQLRKLMFGFKSEKLRQVLAQLDDASSGQQAQPAANEVTGDQHEGGGSEAPEVQLDGSASGGEKDGQGSGEEKQKRKGHGRNGADAYEGAEKISVKHPSLKPGDPCPETGCNGKVYTFVPQKLVRITGQAPVSGQVIEIEQLRCNLCLMVFAAAPPEDAGPEKYDATAASMIALLRYGTGVPFNRLEGLQKSFGIPLPASTQWDVVERAAKRIAPAYAALIEEAAQGDVFYNDDTPMKILEIIEENKRRKENKKKMEKLDDG